MTDRPAEQAHEEGGLQYFRDTKNGREHFVEPSSVAAYLMRNDPSFVQIDKPQGTEVFPEPEVFVMDVGHMTSAQAAALIGTLLNEFDLSDIAIDIARAGE